jgi:hypothetical protein
MGAFSNALLDRISGPGQAPVAQINPLDQQEKQQAIAESSQAQQLNAQKIEQQKMMLDDQKTLRSLQPQFVQKDESGKPTGYDWNGLISAAQGKVMPATLFSLQKQQSDLRQSMATATKDELANQKEVNGELYQRAEGLKGITDPNERQKHYESTLGWAQQHGVDVNQWPAAAPDNDHITALESGFGMHAQALADQKTAAETTQANAKAENEGAQAKLTNIKVRLAENSKPGDFDADIDTVFPPNGVNTGGPNRMYKALVNSALSRGDVEGARKYIDQASESQQAINKEIAVNTNPQIQQGKVAVATAEGKARAAIQNGAPISIPAGATGEDALAALDQSTQAVVRMIGDGKSDFKTFTARSSPAYRAQLAAAVHAYNPDFNEATYAIAKKAGEAFTSGSQGQQLMAIGTAREHMKTFAKLADALDTNDVQALNKIGQAFGVQFGSDKKTNFDLAAQAFGGEVGRAFDGAGVTAGEREKAENGYKAAMSKGQFKGAVQTVDELLAGKQKSAKATYDAAQKGKPNFGGESGSGFSVKAPNGKTYSFKDQQSLDAFKQRAGIQ